MHETDSTSDTLQDDAITWFVKVRNTRLSRAERRAFMRWLSADTRHQEAFTAAEQLWSELGTPAQTLGSNRWYRQRPPRRLLHPALAAAVAMLMMLATWWHQPGMIDRWRADYATRPGEQQQVTLADGSTVFLDGDSALSFRQSGQQRQAILLRGRAWFDVTPDANKPFIARQGDLSVRVLGTTFTLDTHGATRAVSVESGQVRVFWKNRELAPFALTAGQQLQFHPGQSPHVSRLDLNTLSAWRQGLFVFDQATLADAAATMESALGQRLILAPSLSSQPITGVFQSSDPAAMVEGLAHSSNLRIRRLPGIGLYLSP